VHVYAIRDGSASLPPRPALPRFEPKFPDAYDPDHTLFLAAYDGTTCDGHLADVAHTPTPRHASQVPAPLAGDKRSARIVDGKVGKALWVGPKHELSYYTWKNIAPERGTIDVWIRPDWAGDDPNTHVLFDVKSDDDNRVSIRHDGAHKRLLFLCRAHGVANDISVDVANWKAGDWHHLAYTYDFPAEQFRAYVDRKPVGTSDKPAEPFALPREMTVGCRAGDYQAGFHGAIDNLHILGVPRRPGNPQ